jgi:hypothetical protein
VKRVSGEASFQLSSIHFTAHEGQVPRVTGETAISLKSPQGRRMSVIEIFRQLTAAKPSGSLGTTEMNTENAFWNWFMLHEAELYEFDPQRVTERENLFGRLATELHKVHSDLVFEFGPKGPRREFVISAGGIKDAFPAVIGLAHAAPNLERWQFTAFRPRRTPINVVEIEGKRIDPRDVQFLLVDNGKIAGLYMFIPGYRDGDVDLKQIGYLLLDEALGEYDVETQLGLIKMLSPDASTEGDRYPLPDLPALFDQLVARLEGRSGNPS